MPAPAIVGRPVRWKGALVSVPVLATKEVEAALSVELVVLALFLLLVGEADAEFVAVERSGTLLSCAVASGPARRMNANVHARREVRAIVSVSVITVLRPASAM